MTTVLVVEDSLTDMKLMTYYLQQAGLAVVSANSGEEAQEKLHSHKPNLIILDVVLPGQSGFELCREIKTDPHTSEIPVVICSTKDTDVDKMWANMLGADAYLPKPVEETELLRTIRQLIK
ncbi:response regulator transcription factor [Aerosakkonema funiforme]|uniref:Response regulator n=2 Tax=Oscillatoriophycideae TaxID=1301283 RepID=A0A926ZJ93_9CYAN|nr:response regulator [Aerosakkonema funiforme]MBD2182676.1 response regulator [Aerosakkonema funiforme FACHB-1375]